MKRLINILYLMSFIILLSCGSSDQKEVKVEFRIAETEFSDTLQEVQYSPTGDKFYLQSQILFSESNISGASAEDLKGHPALYLVFDEKGKSKFAELTARNIGKHLALLFDGKFITAPVIRDTIKDGRIVITGDFTLEEAEKYANSLMKE